MERLKRTKHSSLLQKIENYGRKKFCNIVLRPSGRAKKETFKGPERGPAYYLHAMQGHTKLFFPLSLMLWLSKLQCLSFCIIFCHKSDM
jgi:hypothetical protein